MSNANSNTQTQKKDNGPNVTNNGQSPALKYKKSGDPNKAEFLSQIQNALAANPNTNTANERQAIGLN